MVTLAVQERVEKQPDKNSLWSSLNHLAVCIIMLTISFVWRVVDQFVLGLGSTWMNIMPSKLFPFLILIGFSWRYRQFELEFDLWSHFRELLLKRIQSIKKRFQHKPMKTIEV